MGFIVSDVRDTGNLIASQLRGYGAGGGEPVCGGVQQLGNDQKKYNDLSEAGQTGEGKLREVKEEVRGIEAVRRKLRVE